MRAEVGLQTDFWWWITRWRLDTQVVGPLLHEGVAPLEQVAAAVGRFDAGRC